MELITNNLKEIIIALISGTFGFLGGMKYSISKNKVKIRQKSGDNSTNNAAGGNIHNK